MRRKTIALAAAVALCGCTRAATVRDRPTTAGTRFDYKDKPIDCPGYLRYDRVFTKAQTQIECDPEVRRQVENPIDQKLGNERQGGI